MINTQVAEDVEEFDLGKEEIGKVGLDAKLARWEGHIHEVLIPRLERVVEARDKVYGDIAEGTKLVSFIEGELQGEAGGTVAEPMEAQVDLGHHFYATAELPPTGKIYIDIGLGIYVHYTYTEALAHLKKREQRLEEQVANLTKQASRIKVEMRVIYEAIAEYSSRE